jgi:chromosome segregation ATPase
MVVGAAAAAGIFFCGHLWRQSVGRANELESKLAVQIDRAKQFAADLSKETQTRKRLSEELAFFRKRADKVKRRKAKTPDQPLGTSARIRDHEAEAERFRFERDRAVSERDALAQSISDLESQLAKSAKALERATTPATTPSPSPAIEQSGAESALGDARNDLTSSRERVAKLEEEVEMGRLAEARMRKRMNNQEILYASVRAELDVKKDRLRTQEEQLQRLQALKVVVIDS